MTSCQVGDLMIVRDHINFLGLAGESPLRGPNDGTFGPRFFPVNNLYERKWRQLALEAARKVRLGLELPRTLQCRCPGRYRADGARGGAHHVRGSQLRERRRAQDVLHARGDDDDDDDDDDNDDDDTRLTVWA